MIEVDITNFQNIRKARFKIKGLTCLVGESNIGKTSVCRALNCVVTNPPASGYIRAGEKEARVKVTFPASQMAIEWIRSKGGARYQLHRLGKGGEIVNTVRFDKPGRSVPEPISSLRFLRLESSEVEASIGYADQHHYSFLIDDPKLTVQLTGELQAIARLNKAMKLARSETRKAADEIKLQDRLIQQAEEEQKRLKGFEKLKVQLQGIEEVHSQIEIQRQKIAGARDIVRRIGEIRNRAKEVNRILEALKGADQIDPKLSDLASIQDSIVARRQKVESLSLISLRVTRVKAESQKNLGFLGSVGDPPSLDPLIDLLSRVSELRKLQERMRSIQDRGRSMKVLEGKEAPDESTFDGLSLQVSTAGKLQSLLDRIGRIKEQAYAVASEEERMENRLKEESAALQEYIEDNPLCESCGQTIDPELV